MAINKVKQMCFAATFFSATICFVTNALAAPQGGQITQGSGRIEQSSSHTDIYQKSNFLATQWSSFNIAKHESAQAHQPDASSRLLIRVDGAGATNIAGRYTSNGITIIENQNGVQFSRGAVVNVGGLLATSARIGKIETSRWQLNHARGDVVNHGTITAGAGGVVLAAVRVENKGTITSNGGNVALGAGDTFTVDFARGLVGFEVHKAATGAALVNDGKIEAQGGIVKLTAQEAQAVRTNVVSVGGVVKATKIERRGGVVYLSGGDEGINEVSGEVQADQKVEITGRYVAVKSGARIKASEILVGGDYQGKGAAQNAQRTLVEPDALLDAGEKGRVIVWSDETTWFHGKIKAPNGFAEVSGKQNLAAVNLAEIEVGTLLLDPRRILIVESAPDDTNANVLENFPWRGVATDDAPVDRDFYITAETINNYTSSLILAARDEIQVNAPIRMNRRRPCCASLTLEAIGGNPETTRIVLNADIDMGPIGGDLTLKAGTITTNGGNHKIIAHRIDINLRHPSITEAEVRQTLSEITFSTAPAYSHTVTHLTLGGEGDQQVPNIVITTETLTLNAIGGTLTFADTKPIWLLSGIVTINANRVDLGGSRILRIFAAKGSLTLNANIISNKNYARRSVSLLAAGNLAINGDIITQGGILLSAGRQIYSFQREFGRVNIPNTRITNGGTRRILRAAQVRLSQAGSLFAADSLFTLETRHLALTTDLDEPQPLYDWMFSPNRGFTLITNAKIIVDRDIDTGTGNFKLIGPSISFTGGARALRGADISLRGPITISANLILAAADDLNLYSQLSRRRHDTGRYRFSRSESRYINVKLSAANDLEIFRDIDLGQNSDLHIKAGQHTPLNAISKGSVPSPTLTATTIIIEQDAPFEDNALFNLNADVILSTKSDQPQKIYDWMISAHGNFNLHAINAQIIVDRDINMGARDLSLDGASITFTGGARALSGHLVKLRAHALSLHRIPLSGHLALFSETITASADLTLTAAHLRLSNHIATGEGDLSLTAETIDFESPPSAPGSRRTIIILSGHDVSLTAARISYPTRRANLDIWARNNVILSGDIRVGWFPDSGDIKGDKGGELTIFALGEIKNGGTPALLTAELIHLQQSGAAFADDLFTLTSKVRSLALYFPAGTQEIHQWMLSPTDSNRSLVINTGGGQGDDEYGAGQIVIGRNINTGAGHLYLSTNKIIVVKKTSITGNNIKIFAPITGQGDLTIRALDDLTVGSIDLGETNKLILVAGDAKNHGGNIVFTRNTTITAASVRLKKDGFEFPATTPVIFNIPNGGKPQVDDGRRTTQSGSWFTLIDDVFEMISQESFEVHLEAGGMIVRRRHILLNAGRKGTITFDGEGPIELSAPFIAITAKDIALDGRDLTIRSLQTGGKLTLRANIRHGGAINLDAWSIAFAKGNLLYSVDGASIKIASKLAITSKAYISMRAQGDLTIAADFSFGDQGLSLRAGLDATTRGAIHFDTLRPIEITASEIVLDASAPPRLSNQDLTIRATSNILLGADINTGRGVFRLTAGVNTRDENGVIDNIGVINFSKIDAALAGEKTIKLTGRAIILTADGQPYPTNHNLIIRAFGRGGIFISTDINTGKGSLTLITGNKQNSSINFSVDRPIELAGREITLDSPHYFRATPSHQDLTIRATGTIYLGANIDTGTGDLHVIAGDGDGNDGDDNTPGVIHITSLRAHLFGGEITLTGDATLNAGNCSLIVMAQNNININTNIFLSSGAALHLTAGGTINLNNDDATWIGPGGHITLEANAVLTPNNQNLFIKARSLTINADIDTGTGDLTLIVDDLIAFSSAKPTILNGGNIALISSVGGRGVMSSQDLTIRARGNLLISANINGGGALTLVAGWNIASENDNTEETTADDQQEVANNQESTADNQQEAANNQESTADNQQEAANNQESTADNQQEAANNQESTADNQQEAANNQESTADNQQEAANNQESTEGNQQDTADSQEDTSDNKKNIVSKNIVSKNVISKDTNPSASGATDPAILEPSPQIPTITTIFDNNIDTDFNNPDLTVDYGPRTSASNFNANIDPLKIDSEPTAELTAVDPNGEDCTEDTCQEEYLP